MTRKGIILAGGTGSRLWPVTESICKQLLPIYDKPMIFYPMSILMLSGIRDILIISTESDLPLFKKLFNDGSELGLHIEYKAQLQPNGIAEAFLIGSEFIGESSVALALGDNIIYGASITGLMNKVTQNHQHPTIFAYEVSDPRAYGVVEIKDGMAVSIEEKPQFPKSNYAVPGLYFYPSGVTEIVRTLKPSQRGEYEITDVNRMYMNDGRLNVEILPRGIAWLDTGTPQNLVDASNFVRTLIDRQGLQIACLEEIAYNNGWIDKDMLMARYNKYFKSPYGNYLERLIIENRL